MKRHMKECSDTKKDVFVICLKTIGDHNDVYLTEVQQEKGQFEVQ